MQKVNSRRQGISLFREHKQQQDLKQQQQLQQQKQLQQQQTSLSFLSTAKKMLSGKEYTEFREILKEFKETRSVDTLFVKIFPLFGREEKTEDLLRNFINFVPEKDKVRLYRYLSLLSYHR